MLLAAAFPVVIQSVLSRIESKLFFFQSYIANSGRLSQTKETFQHVIELNLKNDVQLWLVVDTGKDLLLSLPLQFLALPHNGLT